MKHSRHYLALNFVFFATLLPPSPPPVAAADPKSTTLVVSEDEISIAGKTFALGPSVADLEKLWGKPDRVENLANDIRLWDSLGIRSYSEPGSTMIDSLSFTLQKQDMKLAAKNTFTGRIELPKGVITANTKAADLKALGFKRNKALAKFYELQLLSASFLVEIAESDGSLVTISVETGL